MSSSARILFWLLMGITGAAGAQQEAISYKSTEMAPGIYMLEGQGGFTGGNLGLWTGDDGVMLIDSSMQPYKQLTLDAIAELAGGPVEFVINTHVHGDHIGNNGAFSMEGATIIAHDNIRKRMLAEGVRGPDGMQPPTPQMLPKITFSNKVTLHLNGQRAKIKHMHHAHTDGDAFVWFPEANVLHMGDVFFNGLYPYIDLDSGGSVDGFLAAQAKALTMIGTDTKIIPGHGPAAGKADLQAAHDMLMDARDRVRTLVAAGKDEAEILALNPLADYDEDWTWGFINTERMTRTLIKDAISRR